MGAVVTKDVPPGKVVMGVPARVTYTRKEFDAKMAAWERTGVMARLIRKPLRPSPEEVARNPRARSARMRLAERTRLAIREEGYEN
jgi:16S rRNA C1402 N4-methylase RsmH